MSKKIHSLDEYTIMFHFHHYYRLPWPTVHWPNLSNSDTESYSIWWIIHNIIFTSKIYAHSDIPKLFLCIGRVWFNRSNSVYKNIFWLYVSRDWRYKTTRKGEVDDNKLKCLTKHWRPQKSRMDPSFKANRSSTFIDNEQWNETLYVNFE